MNLVNFGTQIGENVKNNNVLTKSAEKISECVTGSSTGSVFDGVLKPTESADVGILGGVLKPTESADVGILGGVLKPTESADVGIFGGVLKPEPSDGGIVGKPVDFPGYKNPVVLDESLPKIEIPGNIYNDL